MPNLSVVASAVLQVTDTTLSPSPQIITRSLNNPTLAATTVFYDPFFQATTAGVVVPLPAATVYIVYVKNLDVTNNLNLALTPVGGAPTNIIVLKGGFFLYVQPAETAGGFTAVSVTGLVATVSCEVLVAA